MCAERKQDNSEGGHWGRSMMFGEDTAGNSSLPYNTSLAPTLLSLTHTAQCLVHNRCSIFIFRFTHSHFLPTHLA